MYEWLNWLSWLGWPSWKNWGVQVRLQVFVILGTRTSINNASSSVNRAVNSFQAPNMLATTWGLFVCQSIGLPVSPEPSCCTSFSCVSTHVPQRLCANSRRSYQSIIISGHYMEFNRMNARWYQIWEDCVVFESQNLHKPSMPDSLGTQYVFLNDFLFFRLLLQVYSIPLWY